MSNDRKLIMEEVSRLLHDIKLKFELVAKLTEHLSKNDAPGVMILTGLCFGGADHSRCINEGMFCGDYEVIEAILQTACVSDPMLLEIIFRLRDELVNLKN
jgi:hypothetical protein